MSAEDPRFSRRLGVIEAFTAVMNSCPSGSVRAVTENALEAIKSGGADAMPMKAYLVLSAMQGWRGDKATQVSESLEAFLAEQERAQR
jgi:hypothetical protein